MKLENETINDIVELKNRYREKLSENFVLPGFPYYNNNMYTEDGQPYYSMFLSDDEHPLKTHRSEEEMLKDTNDLKVPRGVAHHLYADGVLEVSFERSTGIKDFKTFFLATESDPEMKQLFEATLHNIFSKEFVQSFFNDNTETAQLLRRKGLKIMQEFGTLAHHLKSMCQQHFKPTFGVMIDHFVQLKNSRRMVTHKRLKSRKEVEKALEALSEKGPSTLLALGINAAISDNADIESHVSDDYGSDGEKFRYLNGALYNNPAVAQKVGASQCTDYTVKDRKNGDLYESSNHAIGADSHR